MGSQYLGTPEETRALSAFINLSRASDSLSGRLSTHLSSESLTSSQFGVLEALYHLGPMCQGILAQKILKSSGNITMVVDNLEKRALVERRRQGEDRRFVTVHLTEAGRELVGRILPRHVDMIVDQLAVLSAEEQDLLRQLCRRLGAQCARGVMARH